MAKISNTSMGQEQYVLDWTTSKCTPGSVIELEEVVQPVKFRMTSLFYM